ncbi:MAG: hydantoinase B/oxoprolinase family protein [Chloroflexi bacterium]|nr:hydantoinase B/oxoprolinase family protein [Chloroflexota bacterium]
MTAVNPITLEVVRNAIYSIAEEMRLNVMRTSRSPILKEAGDLSCALTDAQGRIIAQGRDIPIHLGVMAFTVQKFLERVPASELRDGDVYFTNQLEVGGNHLPDVKAITPVFFDGEIVAFAINLCHWPDIGGAVPGSYYTTAREIYQEGLQIPPIRVFSAAGTERRVLDLILLNVRGAEEREGDILGQRAANEVAARRLKEVFTRYGRETTLACFSRFLDESEQLMRAAIAEVPAGVYTGDDFLDNDGVVNESRRVAVTITVEGDRATFDFTGTDPQLVGPLNTTYYIACSAVYYATKALFGPAIPINAGCYRPFEILVPKGTLLNPLATAPVVGGNHETSRRAVDAIFKALAPAIPDRIHAGSFGSSGVIIIGGTDPRGRQYISYETNGGGLGAGPRSDGESGCQSNMGNTMNTPVEALEASFPFRIESYELVPGTGGRGRFRGGLALQRTVRLLHGTATLTTMCERCVHPMFGLFDGEPGTPAKITLNPGGPDEQPIPGKINREIEAGMVIRIQTGGGGGYGPPVERSPSLLAADAADYET